MDRLRQQSDGTHLHSRFGAASKVMDQVSAGTPPLGVFTRKPVSTLEKIADF
jgi:hypothetical protein